MPRESFARANPRENTSPTPRATLSPVPRGALVTKTEDEAEARSDGAVV